MILTENNSIRNNEILMKIPKQKLSAWEELPHKAFWAAKGGAETPLSRESYSHLTIMMAVQEMWIMKNDFLFCFFANMTT